MKKILYIVNASAGRQNVQQTLEKIIGKIVLKQIANVNDVFYTKQRNDAFDKAKSLCKGEYDYVVVCGGDGTVNEAIGGMIESQSNIPMAILATGTVNDFATALHLPKTADKFVSMLEKGITKAVDIGKIGDMYFANVVAGGTFSDISFRVPKSNKAKLGPLAYYIEGILDIPELFNTSIPLTVNVDGEIYRDHALLFLISNSKNIGGSDLLASKADMQDGYFDIIIFKKCQITDMIALSKDILLNKHLDSPYIRFIQGKSIDISSSVELPEVDIDGEKGPHLPIHIDVLEKAVTILVPSEK